MAKVQLVITAVAGEACSAPGGPDPSRSLGSVNTVTDRDIPLIVQRSDSSSA